MIAPDSRKFSDLFQYEYNIELYIEVLYLHEALLDFLRYLNLSTIKSIFSDQLMAAAILCYYD